MEWSPRANFSKMAYPRINVGSSVSLYSNSKFQSPLYLSNQFTRNPPSDLGHYQQQREHDREFIKSFIKTKNVQQCVREKHPGLKIFEAKKHLMDIMTLKRELEFDIENLDINDDKFDEVWESIIVRQQKISDLLSKFNSETLDSLKFALQKRAKKRMWEKRMRAKRKLKKKLREDDIKRKHTLIGKLLLEKSKEAESIKRREALKRQADSVLHEVRKKKYEARKMLNILAAILKLRDLRSHQEIALGGYCSKEITATFNDMINHFQNLWKNQSETYSLEERGLKVMLEENEIPQLRISSFQKMLNQWEQAIFGIPLADDSYTFLTQADSDINSLIFVRKEWDQYATEVSTLMSSCIPVGWVLPVETEDGEWKSFVRIKKKN